MQELYRFTKTARSCILLGIFQIFSEQLFPGTFLNCQFYFLYFLCTGQPCNMHPYERKECGWFGISRATCESRGCCYDDSMYGVKWCFQKQSGIIVT